MKKILILYILLCVFALNSNAQMYSTSPYIQQRVGYSNYQEKNNDNQSSLGYSNGSRIGYTSQYINVYKPNANFSYDDKGYFNQEQDNYMPNMRRSPGDKANGSETVTVDGYSATISWNVEAGFLGLAYWVITYSDGTSETFWGTFNQAKSHAARVAADKAKAQAEKMASNPGDPYADPIGSFPLGLLLILAIIYSYYKKRKTMG